jgi:hypothetical protein
MSIESRSANCLTLNLTQELMKKGSLTHNEVLPNNLFLTKEVHHESAIQKRVYGGHP